MKNGLFKLAWNDVTKGLITAVFSSVVVVVYNFTQTAGFDFFTADYGLVLHNVVNVAGATFIGYIFKNFLTTNDGKVVGVIDTQ